MTDARPTTTTARLEVARGEMQPWRDDPVGGPALVGLLDDRWGSRGSVLVLGPHADDVVDHLVHAADTVTVLRRSVSDATELATRLPAGTRVVAGSLDGFVESTDETFDLVVAADGLDRVLSTDSPALSWSQRLSLASKLVAPGGELLLAVPNELSVLETLDARPAKDRHGDEEWWPLHSDPSRPHDPSSAAHSLAALGFDSAYSWTRYGEGSPLGLVPSSELVSVGSQHPYTDLLVASARRTNRPLLADPEELVRKAARAGRLADLADGWLMHATSASKDETTLKAYVTLNETHVAELVRSDGRLTVSPRAISNTPARDVSADGDEKVSVDPALLPASLVESASVTSVLLAYAEEEDVPGFRRQAAAVGAFFSTHAGERAVTFGDLYTADDTIVAGLSMTRWETAVTPTEALAAAWFVFQDELHLGHRRHPWPPWVVGDDLVVIWLGMSGHDVADSARPALLRRARELADALVTARGAHVPGVRDVRSALADADRAMHDLFEAKGHIAGLERTLGFRDRQLATREERIRLLRKKIARVERLQQTVPYKLAKRTRKVLAKRDPKELVSSGSRVAKRVARKVIKR